MSTPCHRVVFRDDREYLSSDLLLSQLHALMQELAGTSSHANLQDQTLDAFLRASELECAVSDILDGDGDGAADFTACAEALKLIANLLAHALTDEKRVQSLAGQAVALLSTIHLPAHLQISRPEGYCYYALHPLDYFAAAKSIRENRSSGVLIVGIRSMGTSLSAICLAAARETGSDDVPMGRITVRPKGHPYDRTCLLSDDQLDAVERYKIDRADFLIVDEGPGLSGSSFLASAEALEGAGVAPGNIILLCSHPVETGSLAATDAAERWARYKVFVASPTHDRPASDAVPLYGGHWREYVFCREPYQHGAYSNQENWPAVWTQLSSPKFLSHDKSIFYKYQGLGRYGEAVRQRSSKLADDGFAIPVSSAANGFAAFPWIDGRVLSPKPVTPEMLQYIAEYIDYRARAFPSEAADHLPLEEMTRFNLSQVIPEETPLNESFSLRAIRPVIADARMMPYEWLVTKSSATTVKLDCGAHGDNHFFPGPVDVAWDLAGAIVEWEMNYAASEFFLESYTRLSGDDPRARLDNFLIAYAAFQEGYSKMAASAMGFGDPLEVQRLLRENLRYCNVLLSLAGRTPVMSKTRPLRTPPPLALPA